VTLLGLLALFRLLFAALSTMLWLLVGRPTPRMALAAGRGWRSWRWW
jgi:hypothetical protein